MKKKFSPLFCMSFCPEHESQLLGNFTSATLIPNPFLSSNARAALHREILKQLIINYGFTFTRSSSRHLFWGIFSRQIFLLRNCFCDSHEALAPAYVWRSELNRNAFEFALRTMPERLLSVYITIQQWQRARILLFYELWWCFNNGQVRNI